MADEGYRANIWVVVEPGSSKIPESSLEGLGTARDPADLLGERVEAILLGTEQKDLSRELISRGADTVYMIDVGNLDPRNPEVAVHALVELAQTKLPEAMLFASSEWGEEVAARTAQRLGTGILSGCSKVELDISQRLFVTTRPVYGDRLLVIHSLPNGRPQIATLLAGSGEPFPPDDRREGTVEEIRVVSPQSKVQILRAIVEREKPRLGEANLILVGGRGLGSREGFALLEEVAEFLGGKAVASRGACEEGWAPWDLWVGRLAIHPQACITFGVAGDMQHFLAMRQAQHIVAIHSEPDSPIFRIAELSIVGDPREIIESTLAEVKKAKIVAAA